MALQSAHTPLDGDRASLPAADGGIRGAFFIGAVWELWGWLSGSFFLKKGQVEKVDNPLFSPTTKDVFFLIFIPPKKLSHLSFYGINTVC